ncbi:MAG: DUF6262 family protein [Chloroflexota bacterium]
MSRRRVGHQRNVDGLRAASALKHHETERKVGDAIRALLRAGETITFRRVASAAGVSSGWLYAQPDVKEQITRLRGQTLDMARRPSERASDASKDAIVRALRQRVGTLDKERLLLLARIDELQQRIEFLYGELYTKRVDSPYAIADSTAPRSTL